MWSPRLLSGGNKRGLQVERSDGTARQEVLVLLDPPRNALPRDKYAAAQRNTALLYQDVPRDKPFLVGLQDEPWTELERLGGPGGGAAPANYLESGGLGIVAALLADTMAPRVARLENAQEVRQFRALEARAIGVMSEVAPFFGQLADVISTGAAQRCSAAGAECFDRAATYHSTPGADNGTYLRWLLAKAESLGVSLAHPRYRAMREYERMGGMEREANQEMLKVQRGLLGEIVKAIAGSGAMSRRAAWEVHASGIPGTEENEARLAEIAGWIAADEPPEPSADAVGDLRTAVRDATEEGVVRVLPGRDKLFLLGPHGEKISSLLELAAVLGLETGDYPHLASAVVYAGSAQAAESDPGTASRVIRASRDLEREVFQRAAVSDADRLLLDQIPTFCLLRSVERFQVAHDQEIRATMLRLNVSLLCERLRRLGITPPDGWRETTPRLEDKLDTLRAFFDRTVLRGKDLPGALVRAMCEAGVERGLVCSDGFQHSHVGRWLEGQGIGHVMIAPSW